MSILDLIIDGVRQDLANRRLSMNQIYEEVESANPVLDCLPTLLEAEISIIAEVKRSSPSKGQLAQIHDPAKLAADYQKAGAKIVSVLTEERHFAGSLKDLIEVRKSVDIPILRKDFMIDEYQFFEARANGADLVLLIVAALSKSQLKDYYDLSKELNMRALIEVHTPYELEQAIAISPEIIGVNARNLKNLEVDLNAFAELIPQIPSEIARVAESGISSRREVEFAINCGANALLVGEVLVRSQNPLIAINELLGRIEK